MHISTPLFLKSALYVLIRSAFSYSSSNELGDGVNLFSERCIGGIFLNLLLNVSITLNVGICVLSNDCI